MSIFERCLTLWAALCTIGITLGRVMRGVSQAIGSAEVGRNLPEVG